MSDDHRPKSDRRAFLKSVALGLAASPVAYAIGNAGESAPAGAAGSGLCFGTKRALLPTDLDYVGVFRVPKNLVTTGNLPFGSMTCRTVNGQLRFFMMAGHTEKYALCEFAYPGYGDAIATSPRAESVRRWGHEVYDSRWIGFDGNPVPNRQGAQLCWDEELQCLWWTYTDNYNNAFRAHPQLGATVFNDAAGTFTSFGPWRINAPTQQTAKLLSVVPPEFRDVHLGGRRIAIGDLGTASGNSASSWGPVIRAVGGIVPRTTAEFPATPGIEGRKLVGYTWDERHPRSADWVAHGYPDQAGLWTQFDGYTGSGTWVDTPTRRGIIFFQARGTGHIWYGSGTCAHGVVDNFDFNNQGPHATGRSLICYALDPDDCIPVIKGQAPSHTPRMIEKDMSGVGLCFGGWARTNGTCFDPNTGLLFVSTNSRESLGIPSYPVVTVFRVN